MNYITSWNRACTYAYLLLCERFNEVQHSDVPLMPGLLKLSSALRVCTGSKAMLQYKSI